MSVIGISGWCEDIRRGAVGFTRKSSTPAIYNDALAKNTTL
ncbi:MAG: hypothetical protein ACLFVL_06025 [Candidatus Aenigmatarchaeota archaeon]